MIDRTTENVNGFVIGDVSTKKHYMFLSKGRTFCTGNFSKDAEAINYLKKEWPSKFKDGIEIRCFDDDL